MTRFALAAALVFAAAPAVARPAPGLYCPVGRDAAPILVERGGIGIDGLDCQRPRYGGGRVRAARCYANGGSVVSLDEDLVEGSDGLRHGGVTFHRWDGPRPCPEIRR